MPHGEARQAGWMWRLQTHRVTNTNFFVLCNWIKMTAVWQIFARWALIREAMASVYTLWRWYGRGSMWWKAVALQSSLFGLGPPKTSAAQMSTFYKATRHKKHTEECPLHFILPESRFYIKAPKLATARNSSFKQRSARPQKILMQVCIRFTKKLLNKCIVCLKLLWPAAVAVQVKLNPVL